MLSFNINNNTKYANAKTCVKTGLLKPIYNDIFMLCSNRTVVSLVLIPVMCSLIAVLSVAAIAAEIRFSCAIFLLLVG
jgi:hypothetical protein